MSNVKTINKDHNFSCQFIKVAEELSSELSKRKLNCQKIIFIMQDKNYRVQRHTLKFTEPTNDFRGCANLLVNTLKGYKDSYNPAFMCLQISKFSVAV